MRSRTVRQAYISHMHDFWSTMSLAFYDYLTRHVVPGPRSLTYFAPFILLPLALLIPRTVLSRWQSILLFMPIIAYCSVQAWIDMHGVDVISVNALLWSAFMIALEDPWQDFQLLLLNDEPGRIEQNSRSTTSKQDVTVQEQSYPGPIGERAVWIGKLLASIRLDNWKIGRPSHDRMQPPAAGFKSRKDFLMHAMLSFIRGFLVLDLTRSYIEHDAYFKDVNVSISSPLPFDAPTVIIPQIFRSMVIGAQAWALIGQMFYLPASIPVILNAFGLIPDRSSPHNWPSYFGPVSSVFRHGVRGFWGTFWHQTMRWSTTGPGYTIADSMRLSHKSLLRYAILSVSAFTLSGIVHMGLVPPEPLHASVDVNVIRLKLAGFFWLQAVAVTLEALTAKLVVKISGPETWSTDAGMTTRMLVNCIWVISWFSLCLPLLGEAARQLGYWRVWPLPISLMQWLNGADWYTWG